MEDKKKIILETKEGEKVELNVQKEPWYKKAWEKTKSATTFVVDKVIEHPLATVIVVSSITKLACGVMDSYAGVKRANNQKQELNRGKFEYYDRSTDLYYRLKRPMTNTENIEFTIRRKNGEDAYYILSDMNLI